MLSVRVDDEVADRIDTWCRTHGAARSDFVREALRRELNRRLAFDEAERLGELGDAEGNVADHGKFMVVWKRVGDEWKLHRDIWNTSTPPA